MNRTFLFVFFTTVFAALVAFNAVQAAPGDLDQSFSGDGKAFASFSTGTDAEAYDAVYDSYTGKITVAGMVSNQVLGSRHIALARFTYNGKLDTTFGNSGRVDQSFGQLWIQATAIAHQSHGKVVVAGESGDGPFVARFNANGSVDGTFGTNGIKILQPQGMAKDVAIQDDGKIVVALAFSGVIGVTRLNSNGSIDSFFGVQGLVTIDFFGFGNEPSALAIQEDGNIGYRCGP